MTRSTMDHKVEGKEFLFLSLFLFPLVFLLLFSFFPLSPRLSIKPTAWTRGTQVSRADNGNMRRDVPSYLISSIGSPEEE